MCVNLPELTLLKTPPNSTGCPDSGSTSSSEPDDELFSDIDFQVSRKPVSDFIDRTPQPKVRGLISYQFNSFTAKLAFSSNYNPKRQQNKDNEALSIRAKTSRTKECYCDFSLTVSNS